MPSSEQFDVIALGNATLELLSWVDRYPGASDGIHTDKQLWTGGGMSDPDDPKGLIRESYRMEGIGPAECRSNFLDWA